MVTDRSDSTPKNNSSGRHWGRWHLGSDKVLSLDLFPNSGQKAYHIDFGKNYTEASLMNLIFHLSGSGSRGGITLDDIYNLIVAYRQLKEKS